MEPDDLREWLKKCPVTLLINNGDTYEVASPEFALVGDYSVAVLSRKNGRMLNSLLALVNISEISGVHQPADQPR
jgi:hypothetical protein